MYFLFIDTSLDTSLAALYQDRVCLGSGGFKGSHDLLKSIKELLGTAGLSFKDLAFILVGAGPGSYTGIRMGVATAKALAFALEIPVYGISSLSVFSDADPVIFDAKSGGVYLQEPGQAPYAIANADIAQVYSFPKLITPSLKALEKKLLNYQGIIEEKGYDLALIGAIGVEAGVKKEEGLFKILYLKKTQAEIEKERRSLS